MIDCKEWKTEKLHECANMGKEKNDSNYDGNCTARHCLRGTYEISRRWIFVGLSVRSRRLAYLILLKLTPPLMLHRVSPVILSRLCKSKRLPQHPILENPPALFFHYCQGASFTPIQNRLIRILFNLFLEPLRSY